VPYLLIGVDILGNTYAAAETGQIITRLVLDEKTTYTHMTVDDIIYHDAYKGCSSKTTPKLAPHTDQWSWCNPSRLIAKSHLHHQPHSHPSCCATTCPSALPNTCLNPLPHNSQQSFRTNLHLPPFSSLLLSQGSCIFD
jgi:hypothetical protein